MSGFKPGALALIIKSEAGNAGKIVELVQHLGMMKIRQIPGVVTVDCWAITHTDGLTVRDAVTLESRRSKLKDITFPTAWLRPLPPEDDVKEFDTIQVLEELNSRKTVQPA